MNIDSVIASFVSVLKNSLQLCGVRISLQLLLYVWHGPGVMSIYVHFSNIPCLPLSARPQLCAKAHSVCLSLKITSFFVPVFHFILFYHFQVNPTKFVRILSNYLQLKRRLHPVFQCFVDRTYVQFLKTVRFSQCSQLWFFFLSFSFVASFSLHLRIKFSEQFSSKLAVLFDSQENYVTVQASRFHNHIPWSFGNLLISMLEIFVFFTGIYIWLKLSDNKRIWFILSFGLRHEKLLTSC